MRHSSRSTLRGVVVALCTALSTWAALAAQEYAPLPEKLVAANAVYLINDSGDLKAYDRFFKELRKLNRFTVVASRDRAEIVMVLTSSAEYALTIGSATAVSSGGVTTGLGTAIAVPSTFLHLKIFDSGTAEVLWSDTVEKWVTSGHAPSKLVSNLKKRLPRPRTQPR